MELIKNEICKTETVEHSKQVIKERYLKVFEELSCSIEIDLFFLYYSRTTVWKLQRKKMSGLEECPVKGQMEQDAY